MRIALDSNVLVYAEGIDDRRRRDIALSTIERLPQSDIVISVQVLGELFNAAIKFGRRSRGEAGDLVGRWLVAYDTAGSNEQDVIHAVVLATDHHLQIWDAIILSVSASAGCRMLLSEDMQHGFEWRGVTVVNPFLPEPHPLLRRAFGR